MQQIRLPLFYNLQDVIRKSDFHRKYDLLFQSLDLSAVRDTNTGLDRTGYSRHAILRAFIVKHLEEIKSVPRLIEFLDAHPVLTEMCGFDMGALPDESQFYKFLSQTNTSAIETLHHAVNQKLIDADVVSLSHFIMDSKPVMAATRRNSNRPRAGCRFRCATQLDESAIDKVGMVGSDRQGKGLGIRYRRDFFQTDRVAFLIRHFHGIIPRS
ncbi:MAG: transposase [Kiritimatiellaeota bacterium]|nr:transposase [Kiritimatiellota bacterium]